MRGLLVFNVPAGGVEHVPFEQLVSRATRVGKVQRRSVDGKELVVVELTFDPPKDKGGSWDVEVYFDPAVNYLARRAVYVTSGPKGRFRREDEVTEFKECSPGVFFPERLVGRSGPEGNFDFNHGTVISDIRVNQPLPENIFRLRYPHGIYLTDTIRGTRYRIDGEGNPISPEERLERVLPPPSTGEADSSGPGTETTEEPRSITRWILPVSLGIVVLGGVGALVRRWRRIRSES